MKNFTRKVISIDYTKIENYKKEFNNISNNVNEFKLAINANLLNTNYTIADTVGFLNDVKSLESIFKDVQVAAIKLRGEKVGVTIAELEKLENVQLSKVQLELIATAKKLKNSLLFKYGMNSKTWLIDGSIVLTKEVEQAITEACSLYTTNNKENSRLAVLKAFRKHLELDKYDKTVMLKILSNNNPESFIGYQSK